MRKPPKKDTFLDYTYQNKEISKEGSSYMYYIPMALAVMGFIALQLYHVIND